MKKLILSANEQYIEDRNALIPLASQGAMKICSPHGGTPMSACLARQFSREMTRLTEEAGLISPGNLALFDNTAIAPFTLKQ